MSVVAHTVEAVEGDQFPEVYQAVDAVVAAQDLIVWAWLSVAAKVIKAAINAPPHFVNPKLDLPRMFFIFLSPGTRRPHRRIGTRNPHSTHALSLLRHTHNLLLNDSKARNFL
jgi:hypothetical protein